LQCCAIIKLAWTQLWYSMVPKQESKVRRYGTLDGIQCIMVPKQESKVRRYGTLDGIQCMVGTKRLITGFRLWHHNVIISTTTILRYRCVVVQTVFWNFKSFRCASIVWQTNRQTLDACQKYLISDSTVCYICQACQVEEAQPESVSAATDSEAQLCTVRTSDFNFLVVLGKGSFGKVILGALNCLNF